MAIKKGNRIQCKTKDGMQHGFAFKAGQKVTMVGDDGKKTWSGPAHLFQASDAPIPQDSPFANPFTKKGEQVEFDHDGQTVTGRVISGNIFDAKIRSASIEYNVPQSELRKSSKAEIVDAPSPMDRWSVRKYRPVEALSEETVAFTAEILYDGKKVADAKNDGHGGCNIYHGDHKMIDRLHEESKAWAQAHGDEQAFESADTWVMWAAEEKPLGISATEHFADAKERWANLMDGTGGMNP